MREQSNLESEMTRKAINQAILLTTSWCEMATFRFNFLSEETDAESPCQGCEQTLNEERDNQNVYDDHEVRIVIEPEVTDEPKKMIETLQFGDHILYRLDDEDNSSNYDLIPGTYEGHYLYS
jgi:hypothetical protein